MGGGIGDHRGGIRGLLEVLADHGEAVEHDLVCAGWTLDDVGPRLPWTALRSFIRQSARQRASALHREVVGDDYVWGLPEQLIAAVVDAVQVGNWQRAAQGSKRKPPKPKPIQRPGTRTATRKVAAQALPLSQAQRIFKRHARRVRVWHPPACSITGCDKTPHARGWCPKHYQRWRRHGTTEVTQ